MIGINTYPGHAFCREEYVEAIKAMVTHAETNGIECKVFVAWNGSQTQWGFDDFKVQVYERKHDDRGIDMLAKKQNLIRKEFLSHAYTHLFMSESDTFPTPDTITAFINYNKDIIASPYTVEAQNWARINIPLDNPKYKKFADIATDKVLIQRNIDVPCVWGIFGKLSRMWDTQDLLPQRGLVRCLSTGIGACLIKREVIEKVGRFRIRFADKSLEQQQFTDFLFGMKAFQLGFEMFVDTDRVARHLHYDFDDNQVFQKWFNPSEVTDLGSEVK